jgi:hypothetical protein
MGRVSLVSYCHHAFISPAWPVFASHMSNEFLLSSVAGICGVRLQKEECARVDPAGKCRATQTKGRNRGRDPQSTWPCVATSDDAETLG